MAVGWWWVLLLCLLMVLWAKTSKCWTSLSDWVKIDDYSVKFCPRLGKIAASELPGKSEQKANGKNLRNKKSNSNKNNNTTTNTNQTMINPRLVQLAAQFISDKLTKSLANNPTFIKFVHKTNENIAKAASHAAEELQRRSSAQAANSASRQTTTTQQQQQNSYSTTHNNNSNQSQQQQQQQQQHGPRSVVGLFGEELVNEVKSLNPFSKKK